MGEDKGKTEMGGTRMMTQESAWSSTDLQEASPMNFLTRSWA